MAIAQMHSIVAGCDIHGAFTFISAVSNAAAKSGVSREAVIGRRWWDFEAKASRHKIRKALQDCLTDAEDQHYVTASEIGGVIEHWENRVIYVPPGTVAIAIAREVFPGKVPTLTPEEIRLLRLISSDLTNKQIAKRLKTTTANVNVRSHRLRQKFGVQTNTGLVLAAQRYGVISERAE